MHRSDTCLRSLLRRCRDCCAVAGVIVAAGALAGCATPAVEGAGQAATTRAPQDARSLGPVDAVVTIVEFTDLQCPYCAQFALETWPVLRARYVDTGRVHFVSRDLPLAFHASALPAAMAARCAGQQGRYWEYREALFRGQARLATAPYDELARRHGLDVAKFAACRTDPAVATAVREDAALASRHGITSTPTFVIGRVVDGQFQGEIITGARPIEAFAERIEALSDDPSAEPAQH